MKVKAYALIASCAASFITPFFANALNLAVPQISETFSASASAVSWSQNSFLLVSAAFLLPFGRVADIVGRKKLFAPGLLVFAVFSFLCAFAWSIEWLILFRGIQGVGAAMIFTTSVAILTSVFPPEERGKVLGINSSFTYLGLSLGPAVGGFMTHNFGWTSIFIFSGALSLAVFVLVLSKLKGEWVGAPGEPFDWRGSAFCVLGLAAFLYGLSTLDEHWLFGLIALGGLLLLLIFVRHETRARHPILPLHLLRGNRMFAYSSLVALLSYIANFAPLFLISLYLQSALRFDPQIAGLLLLIQPTLMVVLSPIAGRLSDRVSASLVSLSGLIICTISLLLFVFIGLETPVYLTAMNLALLGAGFGLFATPNSNALMGSVEKRFYGMASSSLASMRLCGQSISMALATLVLSRYAGSVPLPQATPEQLSAGIRIAFAVFAAVCVLGVVSAIKRQRSARVHISA